MLFVLSIWQSGCYWLQPCNAGVCVCVCVCDISEKVRHRGLVQMSLFLFLSCVGKDIKGGGVYFSQETYHFWLSLLLWDYQPSGIIAWGWGSQPGWLCPPEEHLATFADIFSCHSWGRGCYQNPVGTHPEMLLPSTTQPLSTKDYLAQNVNNVNPGNPDPDPRTTNLWL